MLNEPMPQLWVDDLLCLVAPNLPEGSLTFQFDPEGYVFQHHGGGRRARGYSVSGAQAARYMVGNGHR
jgi:hypothetical protein